MEFEYPEPVVGALILDDGEVFLMKSPKWGGKWIVPGGHVEVGETMQEAVRREVGEETGLEVKDVEFLCVLEGMPDDFEREAHFIFLNFTCRAEDRAVELDQTEGTEYAWVRPREALELEVNDSTGEFIREFVESSA